MKIKIVFSLCFVIFFISSCGSKKELRILGFGYEGEVVSIKKGADTLLNFKIEGRADTNKICFFVRGVNISFESDQLNVSVTIDSSNVNVLDSSLSFSKNDERPFISVHDPLETNGKRRLFTGDKKNNY